MRIEFRTQELSRCFEDEKMAMNPSYASKRSASVTTMSEHANGPWPDIAIPPGEILADELEARGLSQTMLARRMGRPPQAINEIIHGKKAIEPDTAFQLESVLGTPAHVWLNLERDYRLNKARLEQEEDLEQEAALTDEFPYPTMASKGWVPNARDAVERVRHLRSFFGVASLDGLEDLLPDAARVAKTRRPEWGPLAAWLRQGERIAESIETAPYDRARLIDALESIRGMTRLQPEEFGGPLVELCASCGVALVFVPHLPKTYAQGATRWLSSQKALLQLGLRYRWADIFWFTFFHEIGHIIRHGKKQVFIEREKAEKTDEELQADRFAADALIPPKSYREFLRSWMGPAAALKSFAEELGVAPGIVVGRLQQDKRIRHNSPLTRLREKYKFAHEDD